MSIIAIDPGPTQSAFVTWDGKKIGYRGIVPNNDLLLALYQVHEGETHCVCEMVESFGMPVGKEVFETVFWIGRYCEAWTSLRPGTFDRLSRIQVKMHLCNHPRAKDGNIRQALIDRLGPAGIKKNQGPTYGISKDLWSALAVAVCWWDKNIGVEQCNSK